MNEFYLGLHQPSDGRHFESACISINRLRGPKGRKSPLPASLKRVLIDSAAFTELERHGAYRHEVEEYADAAAPWCADGRVSAIVAQDYMCEPFMLRRTGLTVSDHQRLTIERYDRLLAYWGDALCMTTHVLPVLQGFTVADYLAHLHAYGERLTSGMWVGVGSVCKRQGDPAQVAAILRAIKAERPDFRLHGFGVKLTALRDAEVRELLDTADSTAWSYRARKQGRSANDWREAQAFLDQINAPAEPWWSLEQGLPFAA